MSRAARMTAILTREFQPIHLEVQDESHKHAGHAGARPEGETHYHVVIEAGVFKGKSRVQRHQAIYAALAGEFKAGLHALSINAYGPGERP